MITRTQTLIDKNKKNFIIVGQVQKQNYVISSFNIQNYISNPGLTVEINRYLRCQAIMKQIPAVFKMYSNGEYINIDVVKQAFKFSVPNLSGIIRYIIEEENNTFKQAISPIIYEETVESNTINFIVNRNSDNLSSIPKTLKIYPIIGINGFLLHISDSIEKVLHITINDPKNGKLFSVDQSEFRNLDIIKNIWSEFEFEYSPSNHNTHILELKSRQLQISEEISSGVLYIHKNFGNNHITINQTHNTILNPNQINQISNNKLQLIIHTNGKNYEISLQDYTNNTSTLLEVCLVKYPGKLIKLLENLSDKYNPSLGIIFR